MRLILWTMLATSAVLGWQPAAAHPPVQCYRGWWLPSAEVPTTLVDLPAQPYVLLPLEWAMSFGPQQFGPPDTSALGESHLLVEVRDADGVLVPGGLSLREMPIGSTSAAHRPWWRPGQPLAPGRMYTMRVEVMAPPADGSSSQCPWTGFESALDISTRAEPVELRAVVTSVVIAEVFSPVGYGACGERDEERRCATVGSVCCPDPPHGRQFRVDATVDPMVGGPDYYLASFEFRSPYLQNEVPFPFTFPLTQEFSYSTRGTHGPLIPNEECARVTVTNLMDDSQLVSDWACAGLSDYRPAADDGFCDADWCAQLSTPDGVAEPAEPGASERSGGCAAGGGNLWMWLLGAAFVFRRLGGVRAS